MIRHRIMYVRWNNDAGEWSAVSFDQNTDVAALNSMMSIKT